MDNKLARSFRFLNLAADATDLNLRLLVPKLRQSFAAHNSARAQALSLSAFLCVLILNLCWLRPSYNWDMLAYVGVVHSFTENSPKAIHSKTYAEAQRNVPDSAYRALIGEGHPDATHRAAMARDAEHFVEQLPFYSVKPLYPLLMYALNKVGVDLIPGSILISLASYALIGILSWVWLGKYHGAFGSFAFASFFASMPFVLALSGISTPDALSWLIILFAFFLLAETSRWKAAYVLLALSIAARPDNLILVTLVAAYDFVFRKEQRVHAVGMAVVAFGLYKLQTTLSGNYGWTILFYHSFFGYFQSPESAVVSLSVTDYIGTLARMSHPLNLAKNDHSFLLILSLSILALRLQSRQALFDSKRFELLFVSLLSVCARWLVFPHQADHYFGGWYLFVLVMLASLVAGTPESRPSRILTREDSADLSPGRESKSKTIGCA